MANQREYTLAKGLTDFDGGDIGRAVKPAIQATMRPRFRAINPKSMTRPVAKIVSVSKAGSTTWTLTLDRTCASAGLVTGNYCTVKGVRDQTNFANIATPTQITVTGANTLTLVSTTGTATSYGGSLTITNGAGLLEDMFELRVQYGDR